MRLDLLRPDQVAQAVARASIAYVPIGAVEYHGPHLPLGVDMVTAVGVCERACAQTGGVVLPPSYLAIGTLDLPWTLCFSNRLVERWAEEIIDQLHHRGFAQVVLITGHGPLDLVHLLKRVARGRTRASGSAYAACYLEFNATLLTGPDVGEPTVIDHASTVETSWMLALQSDTVDLQALPDDPSASVVGVYGRNPRFTASASRGTDQIATSGDVLAQRVAQFGDGTQDDLDDLRTFVRYCWPEPLELALTEGTTIGVHNPGRASRYLTGIRSASLDGIEVDLSGAWLRNNAIGETGRPVMLTSLGAESGVYVRRDQTATLEVPQALEQLAAGAAGRLLRVEVELAGVTTVCLEGTLDVSMERVETLASTSQRFSTNP